MEHDLVQWRDRSWNPVADEIANVAMDTKSSSEWWAQAWPGQEVNIMVFVDGGRRSDGSTASAFGAFSIKGNYMKLFGNGACYMHDRDSFVAECRSMHLAISRIRLVLEAQMAGG